MTSTSPTVEATEDPNRIPRQVWIISCVAMLGAVMSILDTTIVNVALATLGKDLHSSLAQIQWVITGYMLSLAAVIPVTGWASRRFGAKRIFIISMVLFTFGSLLCGLATSTTELILFRVLQGVGGGMIMPLAQIIMADAAGPKRMGRVMGLVAVPMMLAPTLGPLLGGDDHPGAELALDLLREPDRGRDRDPAGDQAASGQGRRKDGLARLPWAGADVGRPGGDHLRPGRGRNVQLVHQRPCLGDRSRSA